ncbi:dihydrofolate reductase family protein [Streptomyces albidoflavus]|uniref:dihydrofolate reductase family protein n=1 Tax=Streptomyces albidoflavus TaxID=1886 RepID=UPI000AA72DF0|nr:dihydrofolate reductase family protein [Streptomyces albidoflavus]
MAEAVRIGPDAAGGGNLEGFSPTVGRQLLERGLIDEIDLHVAPVLLGDGVRLFDNPGGAPVRLALLNGDVPAREVNLRFRPFPAARTGAREPAQVPGGRDGTRRTLRGPCGQLGRAPA